MTSRPSLWATCLALGTTFLLASCSTSRDDDKSGALNKAASDESGLVANVVSISASGELCPPPTNGNWGDNLMRGNYGVLHLVFGAHPVACADPFRAGGQRCSTDPKCTVTMEIDVPSGTRMGVPAITWLGGAGGDDRPGTITRTYSFAGGERAAPPDQQLPDGDIRLEDSGLSAFSSTCAGSSRVRLTAELVAHRSSSDINVQIDGFIVNPSERFGTVFKSCTSGNTLGDAAKAGDWCQGKSKRPCDKGLVCEFKQPPVSFGEGTRSTVDMATAQGQCIDPKAKLPPAGLQGDCGGASAIGCKVDKDDLVCWHVPGAQANWWGMCLPRKGTGEAPCRQGSPSLGCAEGFVCESSSLTCKRSRGALGDSCGKSDLAPCTSPLFCRLDVCEQALGVHGDPCGSPEYPTCKSPGTCVDGRCQSGKAGLNQACNADKPCRKGTLCLDGKCTPDPTPLEEQP